MILDENQISDIFKKSLKVPHYINKGREYAKEAFAIVEGDNFAEELISKIEHIESTNKAIARRKYSRSVKDLVKRLSQPIGNIYSSVGGSKVYDIEVEKTKQEFMKNVSHVAGNMSLEKWLRQNWMPLYHTDPNGVVMYEYKDEKAYPCYKSINVIRNYKLSGQNIEWILFEPEKHKTENGIQLRWRLIDDSFDRIYVQEGDEFRLLEEETLENPFRVVPGVVNSDISKLGEDWRVSPFDTIFELLKEYAADQSIKTIYKRLCGFPIHWRYVSQCRECTGVGKNGEGNVCGSCDGNGYLTRGDVTDMVTLPVPEEGDTVIAPNIAGFISPDLETWDKYNEELKILEEYAYRTHWSIASTNDADGQTETATGRYIDLQPQINKLNEYADTAEWVESEMSEMLLNFLDATKSVEDKYIYINYGRRYILESSDTILEKYHTAKDNGDSVTILDRLLNEYITAKYKNDPKQLRESLLKSLVEPNVHYKVDEINNIFGVKETAKKTMFGKWWELYADVDKSPEALIQEYDNWFNQNYIENVDISRETQTVA